MERVLADIDAHNGDRRGDWLGHGVLLGFGAPCQLRSLAGQEHGRTIPLADLQRPSRDARTVLPAVGFMPRLGSARPACESTKRSPGAETGLLDYQPSNGGLGGWRLPG